MKEFRPHKLSVFIFTAVSFIVVEMLGIFGAYKAFGLIGSGAIETSKRSGFEFWQMIIVFFIGTLIFLFFLRLSRGRIFFDILFSFAVFFGIWLILGTYITGGVAIIIASMVITAKYSYPSPFTQNLAIILGVAGLAVAVGLALTLNEALILLVLLSFYDIVAVFVTKHMLKLFGGLLERGVIMALMIPFDIKDLFKKFKRIKPKDKFIFLGTGDLALPTVFIVAALPHGWLPTIGAILGSIVGLYITQTIFLASFKRPIPALPPIATATILGYLTAVLFV